MLLFINRYFRRPSEGTGRRRNKGQLKEEGEKKMEMLSLCAGEASHPCAHGCLAAPLRSLMEPSKPKQRPTTTTRISRSNFAKSTTSFLFPNTHFTNHESLPSLHDAFSSFSAAYPQYTETQQADHIRDREYHHLMNHVCLDYTGFNLFSRAQMRSSVASSSSGSPPSALLQPPFFNISYKSASLKSHVLYGNQETVLESAIRRRIMDVLNVSDEEYSMVCTANRTTAFRLLAESYPFHSNKRLLTVYDYESEAVSAMAESAQKKGAKLISASFTWPSLRIHSARLRKKVSKRKKKRRGLFVFPLQSRMTGARYPYLWMAMAQENGWHVVLDACALGPKDMDTLGLSLIKPDFIICSFFKVFGENPSGFAGLFIKKSSSAVLETSAIAKSIGVVSIVPARGLSQLPDDYSGTDLEAQSSKFQLEEDDAETTSSFSGPIPTRICNGSSHADNGLAENPSSVKQTQIKRFEQGETSQIHGQMVSKEEEENAEQSAEIVQLEDGNSVQVERTTTNREADKRAFPGHAEVLRFIEAFARDSGVLEAVRFRAEVVRVAMGRRKDEWVVEWRTEAEAEVEKEEFEAVVVCNGHHTEPSVPTIAGIDRWPGKQVHSHNYRVPEPFRDQIVVVIGMGASAYDISREISKVAKEVHLASRSTNTEVGKHDGHINIWQHLMVDCVHEDGKVDFVDGSSLIADVIIYCTGYKYHFPFLETDDDTVNIEDNRVGPLYKHVFPPRVAPWLSFVGLPYKAIIFLMMELQSKWIAQVLSSKIALPPEEDMITSVNSLYQQMEERGKPKHHTHSLTDNVSMAEYMNWLAAEVGEPPIEKWRFQMYDTAIERIYDHRGDGYRDRWNVDH